MAKVTCNHCNRPYIKECSTSNTKEYCIQACEECSKEQTINPKKRHLVVCGTRRKNYIPEQPNKETSNATSKNTSKK